MFAAAFPWDVAIAAVSTLVAGLGGTWWAGRATRRAQATQWRLEEQRAAAEQLLRAWSNLYITLSHAARDGRSSVGEHGRWLGPLVDFTEWVAALERLCLVADSSLVVAAIDLDDEVWRFHKRVGELGTLANVEWFDHTKPLHRARLALVNTARNVLGLADDIGATSGRPALDDPIWDQTYWNAERQRLEELRRRGGGGGRRALSTRIPPPG